jgi:hypothetical protein
MAQTEFGWPLSLSLSAKDWAECKRAVPFGICPVFGARVGAQVALQRCLILRTSASSLPYPLIHPWQRGHLYFAD